MFLEKTFLSYKTFVNKHGTFLFRTKNPIKKIIFFKICFQESTKEYFRNYVILSYLYYILLYYYNTCKIEENHDGR